jgi:hypothetical protein
MRARPRIKTSSRGRTRLRYSNKPFGEGATGDAQTLRPRGAGRPALGPFDDEDDEDER